MSRPSQDSSKPLLEQRAALTDDHTSAPLSAPTKLVIKTLSIIRIATGAACLVAPRFTCALFRYPVPAKQAMLVRMFGIRDAVLGELLITARDEDAHDGGKREIRRALWAGITADVVDIGIVMYALAIGDIGRATGGLLGAAAVGALGLGAWGLRGL